MSRLNSHYLKLKREYIFPLIDKKLYDLKQKHPNAEVLNFGVGDIALPLAPSIIQAICKATEQMGKSEYIQGYGPSEGYPFLREVIAAHEYAPFSITPEEIFISDGINTDISNIQELFASDTIFGIPNPSYPVYLDVNIMAGRSSKIVTLPCNKDSGFVPKPPYVHCDVVYLCSPNNPTGIAMNKQELTEWIDYAKKENAILLYDNAYSAFIRSRDTPLSIYEIDGAKEVAIEFKSFSKNAGFTGLRCSYSVFPKQVTGKIRNQKISVHTLWQRRQNTKFNGVSYPIQRGAEAVFSEVGKTETRSQVSSYLEQATLFRQELQTMGYQVYGGLDSPYIWWETPKGKTSWDFFDILLEKCQLIAIPGQGFGSKGEGYIRLSAFTTQDKVKEALKRIQSL